MMKKLAIILLTMAAAFPAAAQFSGNGYYRVYNQYTLRYIYVYDATGSINIAKGSADMGAIQTRLNIETAYTDPASVIYVKCVNTAEEKYDLKAQGTGVHDIINHYVYAHNWGTNSYTVSASESGFTVYLYDASTSKRREKSFLRTADSDLKILNDDGTNVTKAIQRWGIKPINQTDNYIAVKPSLSCGGKYYAAYYADYPFKSGMKAYYVSKIDTKLGVAVTKEITGTVPAATPIILEATSAKAEDNKLTLQSSSPSKPADNVLSGNYFAFEDRPESKVAYTVYNAKTMRVLGITSTGKLGFVTATNDMLANLDFESSVKYCLLANSSYLKVATDTPAELTLMTEAEYGALAGISGVQADEVVAESYYSVSGVKLSAPRKGVNIVKYSDGTTRKEIIR
ncbi:MAG: hypothetical protein IJT97_07385 [Bacteroidaceae bacterium]|nr:hypothetical protein [Bacteroidaceae bacterium]